MIRHLAGGETDSVGAGDRISGWEIWTFEWVILGIGWRSMGWKPYSLPTLCIFDLALLSFLGMQKANNYILVNIKLTW